MGTFILLAAQLVTFYKCTLFIRLVEANIYYFHIKPLMCKLLCHNLLKKIKLTFLFANQCVVESPSSLLQKVQHRKIKLAAVHPQWIMSELLYSYYKVCVPFS